MYRDGDGVFPDERIWLRYLRIAAFRGLSDAQIDLGRFYFLRDRDEGDKIRACAFFRFGTETAIDPRVRGEATDWLFRVQGDISGNGMHNCRELARDWVSTMYANGGRAPF